MGGPWCGCTGRTLTSKRAPPHFARRGRPIGPTSDRGGRARSGVTADLPSYGRRLQQLAPLTPDEAARVFAAEDGSEREITWGELDERSTQGAWALAERGLGLGDRLAIG